MSIVNDPAFLKNIDTTIKYVANADPHAARFLELDDFFDIALAVKKSNPREYDEACDVYITKVVRGLPDKTELDLKRLAHFVNLMLQACDPERQSMIDALDLQSAILRKLHDVAPNASVMTANYAVSALQHGDCVEGGAVEDELIGTWESSIRNLFNINAPAAIRKIDQGLRLMSHECLFNVEAQFLRRDLETLQKNQQYRYAFSA